MSKSPAKRGAKVIERPGLCEEEIEEIREAFNLFDAGNCTVHLCALFCPPF